MCRMKFSSSNILEQIKKTTKTEQNSSTKLQKNVPKLFEILHPTHCLCFRTVLSI